MHDANGKPLKNGDQVLVPATITELMGGEDYCNVSIESAIGRRPDGLKEKISFINTGVLVRANAEDLPPEHVWPNLLHVPPAATSGQPWTPPIAHVMQFFKYDHLPQNLQAISKPFADLACQVAAQSSNQETTIALRKLLEAKDAAVRAALIK